jgi:hypothetical protein
MRGMQEKPVRKNIFLMEGDEGFENKSLRGQMNEVIRRSCTELQDVFYELGISGGFPKVWKRLKSLWLIFVLTKAYIHYIDLVMKVELGI